MDLSPGALVGFDALTHVVPEGPRRASGRCWYLSLAYVHWPPTQFSVGPRRCQPCRSCWASLSSLSPAYMIQATTICFVLFRQLVACGRDLARLTRRQQHGRQNGNDGNDDQQFDQGEAMTGGVWQLLSLISARGSVIMVLPLSDRNPVRGMRFSTFLLWLRISARCRSSSVMRFCAY